VYRRTQYATAALAAVLAVACTSSETDPVTPKNSTIARFDVSHTATATFIWPALQEVKGWGVYPSGGSNPFWNAPSIQTAVYNLGATHIRDQVDPALYVSGSTLSNMVLNTSLLNQYIAKIAYAKAHGATAYILAVWTPPALWKTNHSILGSYNGVTGYLQPWAEGYMVAFLTKVMLALKSSSIGLPVALSVQNEPAHLAPYAGCEYTPAQWQKLIMDTRGSFDYAGLTSIVLMGPETGQYTPATYYDYTTDSPGYFGGLGYPSLSGYLDHAVGAYSFHTYAECSIWQTQNAIAAHPKDMWMTEFGNPLGSTELQWTLDMMSAMAAHLVIIPHNYWFWWEAWAPTSGAPPFGQLLGGTTTPIYSTRYYTLQKLFQTVRPGWHVNRLTTTDPSLQVGLGTQDPCTARVNLIGFSNPGGTEAVVEIVNTTSSSKQIQVSYLPGTTQTTYYSDATHNMAWLQSSNVYKQYSTILSPANSVVISIMK
jgi:O-glycosyl hydrolase